jgi:hypothetical protein
MNEDSFELNRLVKEEDLVMDPETLQVCVGGVMMMVLGVMPLPGDGRGLGGGSRDSASVWITVVWN